jgi:hypothetical protein
VFQCPHGYGENLGAVGRLQCAAAELHSGQRPGLGDGERGVGADERGMVRVRAGERGDRLRGHLAGTAGQLLVDHRERGRVAVQDAGELAGVRGDVDDRAE